MLKSTLKKISKFFSVDESLKTGVNFEDYYLRIISRVAIIAGPVLVVFYIVCWVISN